VKTLFAFVALFLVPLALGQDVARPKVPDAATLASKTSQIKAWYLYAVSCEQQIATLKAQLAAAQSAGGGTSSADITAIKTAIAAVDLKVAVLIASLKPAENLKVVAGTGTKGATIAWDYAGQTENISGFRIYRASIDGGSYGIVGSTLPNVHTFTDPALAAGTYLYTIRAYRDTYTLAQESDASNAAAFVALEP
jgi:hypothetical protein